MIARPLPNRVTPWGDIVADPARGRLMGNRGRLHDARKRLTGRRWTTRAWICCRLAFKDRHREVMAAGSYTELFFLDEATALAAGHRPCFECRRADARRFREAWIAALGPPANAAAMDARLHAERLPDASGRRRLWCASSADLPDGTFLVGRHGEALLLWRNHLHRWAPSGYGKADAARPTGVAAVLTPPAVVAILKAGYVPDVAVDRPAPAV